MSSGGNVSVVRKMRVLKPCGVALVFSLVLMLVYFFLINIILVLMWVTQPVVSYDYGLECVNGAEVKIERGVLSC